MKKKKLENLEFAKAAGQSTLLRIDWKDWKKEIPNSGQDIWIVIKLTDGYYPVRGTYWDETLPASKDGTFSKTRWQSVRFDDYFLPEIYIGNKEQKRLIAWGAHKAFVRLGKDCKKCKQLRCICK